MANLIVYYSRKGQNYLNGDIVSLPQGNTERVAETIQRLAGGELFELETEQAYATDYTACTREAQQELRANARPALKSCPASLDGCDTVFLGYPNWWGTAPMCVFTFLERFDWAGKRLLPFCTNEGSGLGHSESDIKRACPDAAVLPGLAVRGGDAGRCEATVAAWLRRNLKEEL